MPRFPTIVFVVALSACSQGDRSDALERGQRHAAQTESFAQGPRYESTHRIADGEEVSVLLVPDRYSEFADERCIIYKNEKIGAVTMHCPSDVGRDLDVVDDTGSDCVGSSRYGDC